MKINMHQRQSVSMNTVPGSTASYVKKSISEHNSDSEAHKELFDSKANKDSLSAVATSGSYNDLTDIPIIKLDVANETELDNLNHEELSLNAGDCVFYKGECRFDTTYLMLVMITRGIASQDSNGTIEDDGYRTFQFIWRNQFFTINKNIPTFKSRVYKHDYSTGSGVWSNWSEYLTSDDVVDELGSTDKKKPLSANQGTYINDKVDSWSYDIIAIIDNLAEKSDKTQISSDSESAAITYEFSLAYNKEYRYNAKLTSISFTFSNEAYADDYTAGLSFDTGDAAPQVDYTNSGILNWVGTDTSLVDGQSIFMPSANKHYDIVFYYNGLHFVGLVNGFTPATMNN